MLKALYFFLCVVALSSRGNCQKVDLNYFDLLFSKNIFVNNPRTIIKMEIKEDKKFFITTKGEIQLFFKLRFNVNDTAAEKMEIIFLSNNGKMSYADSAIFASIQNEKLYFYSDTILNKYRQLDLIDFLNQYFSFLPHSENIFPIAYLYEKGMFYDWDSKSISIITIEKLRSSFGIIWDNEVKKWVKH